MNYNLSNIVYLQTITSPERPAIVDQGATYSYQDISNSAAYIASLLQASPVWLKDNNKQPRVAILGSRSALACIAMLGACWAGATYIPLGKKLPEERILNLLSICDVDALITDEDGAKLLTDKVLSVCPAMVLVPASAQTDFNHRKIHLFDINAAQFAKNKPAQMEATALAYIIFTSGTTGTPKGVAISCGAIQHYISKATELLGIEAFDRTVEMSELSFDFSLNNMFTTWHAGASLHILPAKSVMNAVKFVRDQQLTVWFSVPSLVGLLKQVKALTPNSLTNLRLSVFGGEQLPESVIKAWQLAAPNSRIENLYGPTEATVFCLRQMVSEPLALTPGRDFLSIGYPISGNEAAVISPQHSFLGPGEVGELALTGVQIAEGYLNAPELTESRFPVIAGKRWYLTGDLAMKDNEGRFHCLGRVDHQVKVLGHRVELEEVDAHLRKVSSNEVVATVAWPIQDGVAQGLVGFVNSEDVDANTIKNAMKHYLPNYMVPNQVIAIKNMPLNQNGKVDRSALFNSLQNQTFT